MSGLKYEKKKPRKRTKSHKKSILQAKDGTCYLCMKLDHDYSSKETLHMHHIFGGANRIHSEAEGLTVYLCVAHHEYGPHAAHTNAKIMQILHEDGQRAYERTHTRREFMQIFGKNYLPEVTSLEGKSTVSAILDAEHGGSPKVPEGFRFI